MEKPVANDRRNKIIRYVVENGSAKINELAKKFNVSMETIRKDLTYLEKRRILNKGHGVVTAASSYLENSFALKEGENLNEKIRVAEIAATLVPENAVILLDSGSTTYQLAKLLNLRNDLTIITNSMTASYLLSESKNQILVTGGELRLNSFSYVGSWALNALKQIKADVAFMGCDGFHKNGPSIRSYREIEIKQAMIESAKKSVLLANTQKFSQEGLYCFADFSAIEMIVTERELTLEEKKKVPENMVIYSFI